MTAGSAQASARPVLPLVIRWPKFSSSTIPTVQQKSVPSNEGASSTVALSFREHSEYQSIPDAISTHNFAKIQSMLATLPPSVPTDSIPSLDPSLKTYYRRSAKSVDLLRLRRFKCRCCPYRSNYKSDVNRHVRQKHSNQVSHTAALSDPVIFESLILELTVEEAIKLNAETVTFSESEKVT